MMNLDFGYREVLPVLCEPVGTKNFLWCCTEQGHRLRVVEEEKWELNVPGSHTKILPRT